MNVSCLTSDGISTLMSSISSTTYDSDTYSLYSTLASNLGDYGTIKSGAYYNLLKNYYASSSDSSSSSSTDVTTATLSTEMKLLKVDAADATDALSTLTSSSLYSTTTSTDDDGNTTTSYDVDSIYSAVKSFVSAYNDLLSDGSTASNSSIFSSVSSMRTTTASYYSQLASIGITMNSDGTLSLDEDTFKAADMSEVESLFTGSNSYGSKMTTSVANVTTTINVQVASNSIYNSDGNYTTSLNALVASYTASV